MADHVLWFRSEMSLVSSIVGAGDGALEEDAGAERVAGHAHSSPARCSEVVELGLEGPTALLAQTQTPATQDVLVSLGHRPSISRHCSRRMAVG